MFLVFCGSLPTLHADEFRIFSRSIMDHCHFVYRVESDIRVAFDSEQLKKLKETFASDLSLRIEFFNSWDNEPRSLVLDFAANDWVPGESIDLGLKGFDVLSFTQETMSTSSRYLLREVRFAWMLKQNGDELPLSPWMRADVGRRFGEACQSSRGPKTPWFEREISR